MKDMKRTIKILEEAAEQILSMEHISWDTANTTRSWEEWWRFSYSRGTYQGIREEIQRLEEMNKE